LLGAAVGAPVPSEAAKGQAIDEPKSAVAGQVHQAGAAAKALLVHVHAADGQRGAGGIGMGVVVGVAAGAGQLTAGRQGFFGKQGLRHAQWGRRRWGLCIGSRATTTASCEVAQ